MKALKLRPGSLSDFERASEGIEVRVGIFTEFRMVC
jgi:hypothetical protein